MWTRNVFTLGAPARSKVFFIDSPATSLFKCLHDKKLNGRFWAAEHQVWWLHVYWAIENPRKFAKLTDYSPSFYVKYNRFPLPPSPLIVQASFRLSVSEDEQKGAECSRNGTRGKGHHNRNCCTSTRFPALACSVFVHLCKRKAWHRLGRPE